MNSKSPKKVAFWSVKGGVGRTTLAGVFALKLAMEGKRVLAIDMDLEAPSFDLILGLWEEKKEEKVLTLDSLFLKLQEFEDGNFYVSEEELKEEVRKKLREDKIKIIKWSADKVIRNLENSENLSLLLTEKLAENINAFGKTIREKNGSLFLLPTNRKLEELVEIDYSEVESKLTGSYRRSFIRRFRSILNVVAEELKVDWIVIDCRAGISDPAAAVLKNASHCVLVSQGDYVHLLLTAFGLEWLAVAKWSLASYVVYNKVLKIGGKDIYSLIRILGEKFPTKTESIRRLYEISNIPSLASAVSFYKRVAQTGTFYAEFEKMGEELSPLIEAIDNQ